MIRRCGCPDASPSSICGLVDGSLRRYVKDESLVNVNEMEKELLISLSMVSKRIHMWTHQFDCDSEQEIVSVQVADERCLANIVSILVLFLTSENQFIRHLTGNVLVAIFGYLDKIGHKWAEFLQLLWVTVEMATSNIHFNSSAPSSAGFNSIHADRQLKTCYPLTRDDTDIEIFVLLLRPRLISTKFFMLTSLLQVLRNVLKSLKREDSDHIDVYMYHGVSSLSKLPWNLLNQICTDQTNGGVDSAESKGVFLGTLLQLICSLVEQNIVKEDMGSSFHDFPLLAKVIDLIPELLSCCFTGHVDHNRTCVSQYLRHKSLMLMIRLSSHINKQYSTLISWLLLLQKYFKDIISQPISKRNKDCDICLEESPFLSSMMDKERAHNLSTYHLQRQAIFLLFRCSFNLISLSKENFEECACGQTHSCSTCEEKSSKELYLVSSISGIPEWLRLQFSFVSCENYSNNCCNFIISFLQLFMDEDDLLFEVLLQLLDVASPIWTEQYYKIVKSVEELNEGQLFHLPSIMNPVHLFHLFLSELQYDHLVLLDYLISKDTGLTCLQYLLRCLRLICNSWNTFVEFDKSGTEMSQPSLKKRKTNVNNQKCQGNTQLLLLKGLDNIMACPKRNKKSLKLGGMHKPGGYCAYQDAKKCLLSLKKTLEDLHRKNLFPYNPSALIKSFSRFEQLCQTQ
ncbi:hypothetical protein QJS04_geneDACA006547 [Acorus gramineus]|uniref:Protein Lines C-terminal domain-containing protein n=1 Tax=Acorus gramineus TaxID=55184 RepID=A0AAV9AY50_ACOGR|nr:hypothetical protein QJS04_geneDACA006547 [Acorus gramineus]